MDDGVLWNPDSRLPSPEQCLATHASLSWFYRHCDSGPNAYPYFPKLFHSYFDPDLYPYLHPYRHFLKPSPCYLGESLCLRDPMVFLWKRPWPIQYNHGPLQ